LSDRLAPIARHGGEAPNRLPRISGTRDTRGLIEQGIRNFLAEVPALAPLRLVVGLELRGRGDIQMYRIELPGPRISRDIASDAKVRLELPRQTFNELVPDGTIRQWRAAFAHGDAKVTGVEQIIRLIAQVVAKQDERSRLRRPRSA
jgi:hypothetical protein